MNATKPAQVTSVNQTRLDALIENARIAPVRMRPLLLTGLPCGIGLCTLSEICLR